MMLRFSNSSRVRRLLCRWSSHISSKHSFISDQPLKLRNIWNWIWWLQLLDMYLNYIRVAGHRDYLSDWIFSWFVVCRSVMSRIRLHLNWSETVTSSLWAFILTSCSLSAVCESCVALDVCGTQNLKNIKLILFCNWGWGGVYYFKFIYPNSSWSWEWTIQWKTSVCFAPPLQSPDSHLIPHITLIYNKADL